MKRVTTAQQKNRVEDGKLWFDEQEVTKTDEMTGEETTEYSYIVVEPNEYTGGSVPDAADEYRVIREDKKTQKNAYVLQWVKEKLADWDGEGDRLEYLGTQEYTECVYVQSREATNRLRELECTEAREYLAKTDWMVVRKAETGVEVPQEVLDRRQAMREVI